MDPDLGEFWIPLSAHADCLVDETPADAAALVGIIHEQERDMLVAPHFCYPDNSPSLGSHENPVALRGALSQTIRAHIAAYLGGPFRRVKGSDMLIEDPPHEGRCLLNLRRPHESYQGATVAVACLCHPGHPGDLLTRQPWSKALPRLHLITIRRERKS